MRLEHAVRGNGLKVYEKHGQVLRVETPLTNAEAFRVYRPLNPESTLVLRWSLSHLAS